MPEHLIKIKYGNTLRRIDVYAKYYPSYMGFSALKRTIRKAFGIPIATEFAIVYIDDEGDTVTMGEDFDVRDAVTRENWRPICVIDIPQGESQSSAQNARPPEQVTSDPPPWAAEIISKLDKLLLLAVNKQLIMEPGVKPVRSISTKTEDHLLGVDDSPVHYSRIEPANDVLPSEDCSSEESWLDIAQPGIDSETILRRAAILRQRMVTDEASG